MSDHDRPTPTEMPTSATDIHAGHRRRLRERCSRGGVADLPPHEVLELLLTYPIPRVNVNDLAHELIHRFGSLSAVLDADIETLMTVPGVGPEAARFLHLLPLIFRRYLIDKQDLSAPMNTLSKVSEFVSTHYTGVTREEMCVLLFDNTMRLILCSQVSGGTVNSTHDPIRRIIDLTVTHRASSVILAHNHPHGLAIPSSADIAFTDSLANVLESIGVPLLEHLIVTDHSVAPILRTRLSPRRPAKKDGPADESFFSYFYKDSADDSNEGELPSPK